MADPSMSWGSDVVAELLRRLEIPYAALNPGASYRGLHDSLVNYLGNHDPEMLLCLHEEHAVALAHGYAKVAGRPMAAIVHSNVGLMHASMAIYDAWCDRVPMLVIGATGPVDARARRPWIDWIHTSRDQGALVRGYTKWDAQPASVEEAVDSVMRGYMLAATPPCGPVYVCLDVMLQECRLERQPALPDPARAARRPPPAPGAETTRLAAEMLRAAERPLILVGRVSRDTDAWQRRIRLAEMLGARVITDLKTGATFPDRHPLHGGNAGLRPDAVSKHLISEADVILSLDWIDLAGTIQLAGELAGPVSARIISASLDDYATNGWSYDHQALAYVDVAALTTPDAMVEALLQELAASRCGRTWGRVAERPETVAADQEIDLSRLGLALNRLRTARQVSLVRLPLGWPGGVCDFADPLDFLGYDGGGGIGSGPGMAIGSALALRGSGRLAVAVLGDGDLLMGANALWSAARYRIPLLVVVANNGGYMNDVRHQEEVARRRGRPIENRWVGQEIREPRVDIPALARSLGFHGVSRVTDAALLEDELRKGADEVAQGHTYLIDVCVTAGQRNAAVRGGR